MRLFVCETITGGGLRGQALPPALLRDGEAMFQALYRQLQSLPGLQLITTRDARLPALPGAIPVNPGTDLTELWRRCLEEADAAWVIAPESGGELLRLRRLADAAGCDFIGCDAHSIELTGSKLATARYFSRRGFTCIETVTLSEPLPRSDAGWVVKPDDGAGCEQTWYFRSVEMLRAWRREHADTQRFVLQPRVAGVAASLSVLYGAGGSELLSCNIQEIEFRDNRVQAGGLRVGALNGRRQALAGFAAAVGTALPGLRGYVGIDFMDTPQGPVLVEINPRLTTAYAGLAGILDDNPAARILGALGALPEPEAADCLSNGSATEYTGEHRG